MRHRPHAILLCGAILAAGLLIGSACNTRFGSTFTTSAAHADSTPTPLARLSNDPLIQSSRLLSRISAHTTPSVVHILSEHTDEDGRRIEETGSGALVRSSTRPGTYVVTNCHVIRGAENHDIAIHLSNGHVVNPQRIYKDRETDVALLEVESVDLPAAEFGDSDRVEIGNIVLAMGSPFGLSQSVTLGIISAKGRRDLKLQEGSGVINRDFLQTDAAINPGNSGGPLVDLEGRIIGINTAIASNSGGNEGIGFSIPSNLVERVAEQLLTHGRVRRAYLGVQLDDDFDIRAARRFGMRRVRGARVMQVYSPDTPASRAGLKYNDVIMGFDGREVLDENHLINLVSLADIGAQVQLEVLRDGRRVRVGVVLTERSKRMQVSQKPKDLPM